MPRALTYLMNKMSRRRAVEKPAAATISACHVGPVEDASVPPMEVEDLKDAWVEVEAAARESGVVHFHACSRGGQRWQDDPESVRAVAGLLRER